MDDAEFADILIARLNKLLANDAVREDFGRLIETRVPCSQATVDHPTIQAGWPTKEKVGSPTLGILGILNGLVGVLPDGPRKGWGYITAEFDEVGSTLVLKRFMRTNNEVPTPETPPPAAAAKAVNE